jgi:hypothetical protein
MATHQINWNIGNGKIILNYTGEGNETVSVASDLNNLYQERQQTVTFSTTGSSPITRQLLVKQQPKRPNFKTADSFYIKTADQKYFNAKTL